MNPQIDAFGVDVIGKNPSIANNNFLQLDDIFTGGFQLSPPTQGEPLKVLIYFDKGDDVPTSYIRSEQDLSEWVIIHKGQQYQCQKSRNDNSTLFKTIIVPFNDLDVALDFSANNEWS